MAMQVVEGGRGVLAGDLAKHRLAAWVGVEEIADIVHLAVDDEPDRVLGVVLGDLVARERLRRHCGRIAFGARGGDEPKERYKKRIHERIKI